MPPDSDFQYLTIIGLGLIGGSLAMAARQAFPGLAIRGVEPREDALRFALRHGVIDGVSPQLPDAFLDVSREESHLIVLACHLSQSLEWLDTLAPLIQENAEKDILVTDIGSCKRAIAELGRKRLPEHFIAGHPMAGKALSGIEHATALLFAGKPYLLCPHVETNPVRLARLEGFVRALGAHPHCLDAERHDRYMAYVSHFPQLYAILLANLLEGQNPSESLACHGGGLDDQLRLASSPYAMWGDIFRQNGDNLAQALREFKTLIDEALPDLEALSVHTSALPPISTAHTGEDPWLTRFERANRIERQWQALRSRPG